MNPFLKALEDNDQSQIKVISKIIALAVRNEMEDFHVKYLSDKQMKELNPLVRRGIYNALFALVNYKVDIDCDEFLRYYIRMMPNYWEDPELIPMFKKSYKNLLSRKVSFRSPFLNEQLTNSNITYDPAKVCVYIKASFDLTDVEYQDGKIHLRKIGHALRNEGYYFDDCKQGYVKGE